MHVRLEPLWPTFPIQHTWKGFQTWERNFVRGLLDTERLFGRSSLTEKPLFRFKKRLTPVFLCSHNDQGIFAVPKNCVTRAPLLHLGKPLFDMCCLHMGIAPIAFAPPLCKTDTFFGPYFFGSSLAYLEPEVELFEVWEINVRQIIIIANGINSQTPTLQTV